MSIHKYIDKICFAAALFALLICLLLINGEALGIPASTSVMGYELGLFDNTAVHTIDIQMDNWEDFLETCENEEYSPCAVIIDGEALRNVGIRAKGNTSLRNVSSMNSDRYSFKIEFDKYDNGKNYHGLDKLVLNNLIQDNTCMKDYLVYQMMGDFGVDAPLSSYVYITVNGEDWGLYLAVEGIEDAFLKRNYGSDSGALYKPDSMSMNGGGGNFGGMGAAPDDNGMKEEWPEPITLPELIEKLPEDSRLAVALKAMPEGTTFWTAWENLPDDLDFSTVIEELSGIEELSEMFHHGQNSQGGRGDRGGMGSDDIKLKYIDDDPDSYANIFDNAKTDITKADQARLIQSLKKLNACEDLDTIVNVEEVLRYFVVHNFVCNGDSYTGSIIHNYYLYEENSQLSMIPWDYNLAFGTFQRTDASSAVNAPIDTPVSGGATDDRPMLDWIFSDSAYINRYHQYFSKFLEQTDFAKLISETAAQIAPYLEKDPTKFCTVEEFETAVSALQTFCQLRAESVAEQLAGTIPATQDGQSADRTTLIDASQLQLSDMGTMDMGMGANRGGERSNSNGHGNTLKPGNLPAVAPLNARMTADTNTDPSTNTNSDPNTDTGSNPGGNPPSEPNSESQPPDQMRQQGEGRFNPQFNPGESPNNPDTQNNVQVTGILLAVSILCLAAGLIFAFRFKR